MRAPARRRQLLDAALPRFADGGYRGTTTAELVEAAGVTPPILYRHFDSKLDLFLTLLDEAGDTLDECWRRTLSHGSAPAARRRALLSGPGSDAAAATRILAAAMVEAQRTPDIRAACRRHLERLTDLLAREIGALQRAGAVRRTPSSRALATLLVTCWAGQAVIGEDTALPKSLDSLLGAG